MKITFFVFTFLIINHFFGQEKSVLIRQKRILIILDASGSMNGKWNNEKKWNIAINTLSNVIDTLTQNYKYLSIGVRVLGHQYNKSENNCYDSELLLPFKKGYTKSEILYSLNKIYPKGQTPISYSLEESEKDFVNSYNYQNSIILITDGEESCDKIPCNIIEYLLIKKIIVSPYIIGMGVIDTSINKLNCIGKVINVKEKNTFNNVLKNIFEDIAKPTTLDVVFTNNASEYIYNIPFSLIHKTKKIEMLSYISTDSKNTIDSIILDNNTSYSLKIHTSPPIFIDDLFIEKYTHNHRIFNLDIVNINIINSNKTIQNSSIFLDSFSNYILFYDNNKKYNIIPQDKSSFLHESLPFYKYTIDQKKLKTDNNISLPSKGTIFFINNNFLINTTILLDSNYNYLLNLNSKTSLIKVCVGKYFLLTKSDNKKLFYSKIQPIYIKENEYKEIQID